VTSRKFFTAYDDARALDASPKFAAGSWAVR
jgi:hypothetical protein